ncbi:MAG: DUF5320 domain-containing protein [Bacteroidales bacterium]|nr:DUF5320 domain-containing protein [Bacteroidales bacterium]
MPNRNGKGPENQGPKTGRGLGKCRKVSPEEANEKLGIGQGLRRKSGGGKGFGRRLKYGVN